MKKRIILLVSIVLVCCNIYSQQKTSQPTKSADNYEVFSSKGYFGLKFQGNVVVGAKYSNIKKFDKNFYLLEVPESHSDQYGYSYNLFSIKTNLWDSMRFTKIKANPIAKDYYNLYPLKVTVFENECNFVINDKGESIVGGSNFESIETINRNLFIVNNRYLLTKDSILFESKIHLYPILYFKNYFISGFKNNDYKPEYGYAIENFKDIDNNGADIIDSTGKVFYHIPATIKDHKITSIKIWSNSTGRVIMLYTVNQSLDRHHEDLTDGIMEVPSGKEIVPLGEYKILRYFTTELIRARNKMNSEGLINLKDEEVLPFIYQNIDVLLNGKSTGITKENKEVLINENGKIIPKK